MVSCLKEPANKEGSSETGRPCGIIAIEPDSAPRNWSLKTRMEKNEFVAAVNCSAAGLVIRALLPFNPLRSTFSVTLPLSTIIF